MQIISRKKTLQQMRRRDTKGKYIPFSLVVCKLNYATHTGGGRLHVEKAVMYDQKHVKKPVMKDRTRIPNHEDNGTRNIKLIPSGVIRTVHIRLIEKFNDKIVFD